jgi:hypothetical protein
MDASVANGKPTVFICYSHEDRKWAKRLRTHLKYLERNGSLDVWDDSRIQAGSQWKAEIERALHSARAAVLLLSADFMASDYVQSYELPALVQAARGNGLTIFPLYVGFILDDEVLSGIQAVNNPDRPLIDLTLRHRERILRDMCKSIKKVLEAPAQSA